MDSIEVRHAGRMVELVDVIAEAFAPGIVSALALLGPACMRPAGDTPRLAPSS